MRTRTHKKEDIHYQLINNLVVWVEGGMLAPPHLHSALFFVAGSDYSNDLASCGDLYWHAEQCRRLKACGRRREGGREGGRVGAER